VTCNRDCRGAAAIPGSGSRCVGRRRLGRGSTNARREETVSRSSLQRRPASARARAGAAISAALCARSQVTWTLRVGSCSGVRNPAATVPAYRFCLSLRRAMAKTATAVLSGVGTRNPSQISCRYLPSFVLVKTHVVVCKRAIVANQKSVCLSRSPAYHKDLRMFVACDLKHLQTSHSMNLRKLQRLKFNDCLKFPRPAVVANTAAAPAVSRLVGAEANNLLVLFTGLAARTAATAELGGC